MIAAAANTVLDIVGEEGFLRGVAAKGERLAAGCATSAWRSVDAG